MQQGGTISASWATGDAGGAGFGASTSNDGDNIGGLVGLQVWNPALTVPRHHHRLLGHRQGADGGWQRRDWRPGGPSVVHAAITASYATGDVGGASRAAGRRSAAWWAILGKHHHYRLLGHGNVDGGPAFRGGQAGGLVGQHYVRCSNCIGGAITASWGFGRATGNRPAAQTAAPPDRRRQRPTSPPPMCPPPHGTMPPAAPAVPGTSAPPASCQRSTTPTMTAAAAAGPTSTAPVLPTTRLSGAILIPNCGTLIPGTGANPVVSRADQRQPHQNRHHEGCPGHGQHLGQRRGHQRGLSQLPDGGW